MHKKILSRIASAVMCSSIVAGLFVGLSTSVLADSDSVKKNMAKVLGSDSSSRSMKELLKNGQTIVTNGGAEGSDNMQIGENISKLDGNDKCVALRLVLFNRGLDSLASVSDKGVTQGDYSSFTTATKGSSAADQTEISAGVLTLADFVNLVGSQYTEQDSTMDIGLVASIDQSKNKSFLAKGSQDKLAVYSDTNEKSGKVSNPNYVVARFKTAGESSAGDLQQNFTMTALYQIINSGLKSSAFKVSQYLCVDMYGNIITSEGNLILPYFMNANFVNYPSISNKFMSVVQAGQGYLANASSSTGYADLMNNLGETNRSNYFSYPMFLTFGKNTDGTVSLLTKKVGSSSLTDDITKAWSGSDTKVSTKNDYVNVTVAGGYDDFHKLFLSEKNQPAYENTRYVESGQGKKDNYNLYYSAQESWILFNQDFFNNLFVADKTKYLEFYGVMFDDNQVLLPAGCGNEVLVGASSAEKNITDKITDTLDDPYTNSFVPMVKKWTVSDYTSWLQGTSGNDTVKNSIVYTQDLIQTSLFQYYRNSCFMFATMVSGGLLLITFFKKLRGSDIGSISEALIGVVIIYLVIVSPVVVFPYVLDLGFDRPSMMMLSNLIDDSLVDTMNNYYKSVDGSDAGSKSKASVQALATQLDNFEMKPSGGGDLTVRNFLANDKLALLCEQAVSLRFPNSTLNINSDLKVQPSKLLDSFSNNPDTLDVSSVLQDKSVKMQSKDGSGKTVSNVGDPFYVYDIIKVYSKDLRSDTISSNNPSLKYPSYSSLVSPDGKAGTGDYDSNGINKSNVNRIITNVNIKMFSTFTENGKNLYPQLNTGTFVRLTALYIAEEIDSQVGGDYSRFRCINLTTDDFMQGLLMPRATKVALNTRNSAGMSKSELLVDYVNDKTTVFGLFCLNIFMLAMAAYGLIRAVLLLVVMVVGSAIMLLVYPFEKDFRNKALIGIVISILIIMLAHIAFLGVCRIFMTLINL